MVNRISTSGKHNQLVADMQRNLFNYNKLTQQLASGSKLTSITDDPIATVNVLNTNRQLGQIDVFAQNVELAQSELSTLDDLMELGIGYLNNAWGRAVQANNQTYTGTSLEAIKVEIDETIKTMVDLANTEFNDNFIFGGANTKISPYEIDDEGNIIYRGTPHNNPDYIRQTEVADGVFEVINTTGDRVFGYYKATYTYADKDGNNVNVGTDADGKKTYTYDDGTAYTGDAADLKATKVGEEYSGVMGAMKLLSNSIQMVLDGDEVEGYEVMNSTLNMFKNSLTTMSEEQTKFGGVANRLDMSTSTLETNSDSLTSYLSSVRDVDYATAITNWLNAQYAYQASLQVSSAAMNMSLLNYL